MTGPLSKEQMAPFEIPADIMNQIYNVLSHYANECSYVAPRTGGVAAGCPRGETPTPDKMAWPARFLLRKIERDVLSRDAWDWITKYPPDHPHCDTCQCVVKS